MAEPKLKENKTPSKAPAPRVLPNCSLQRNRGLPYFWDTMEGEGTCMA